MEEIARKRKELGIEDIKQGLRFKMETPALARDDAAAKLFQQFKKRGPGLDELEMLEPPLSIEGPEGTSTPLFYNVLREGIEWNKYNQTHFDEDNPPPKVV